MKSVSEELLLCSAANFTHNKSADKGIKIERASFFLGMMIPFTMGHYFFDSQDSS